MLNFRLLKLGYALSVAVLAVSCTTESKSKNTPQSASPPSNLNGEIGQQKAESEALEKKLAEMQKQHNDDINSMKEKLSSLQARVNSENNAETISGLQSQISDLKSKIAANQAAAVKDIVALKEKLMSIRTTVDTLENKIMEKLNANGLANTNIAMMKISLDGHTGMYSLKGTYNTLVIPVEFAADEGFDGSFKDPAYFESGQAQENLFGNGPDSMHSFYQHASGGLLNVTGEVVKPIRVDKPLSYYGKAVAGVKDEHARELVTESLKRLIADKGANNSWWNKFDQWDLNDLDQDGVYSEPDGFIDAVVLAYAGKEQASCQGTFDPENKQPGTDDIPADDPRAKQAKECYNRIWPHRSSIFLPADSADFPKRGPRVEGQDRGALGFKINDSLHAFDYNMQSEYSDVSTFAHEFGHSLTLPDLYAVTGGDNSVSSWDLMAANARNNPQEFTAYHRMALGWINPKIVNEGEDFSAYLGSLNYVSQNQRENRAMFTGPDYVTQLLRGADSKFSVASTVPESNEPVYRALMVRLNPSTDRVREITLPESSGTRAAYSGRFDNGTRSLRFKVSVPESGNATLSFDTFWHIETETNFASREPEIRIITDYDTGAIKINGEVVETLRLLSGDENNDSLAELNPDCDAKRVLELRSLIVGGKATAENKLEFKSQLPSCQRPIWVKKSYDLLANRGKSVSVEIAYNTDPGYNETGIFVDNIKLGDDNLFDFEDGLVPGNEWALSVDGNREVKNNQFYMLEFRDPEATFAGTGSYNKDANIQGSTGMAMMLPKAEGLSTRDRFRMVTLHPQPGVLGWFFDSKYDRRSNTPEIETQKGHGYYLPINSQLRELNVPGVFSSAEFKDANGFYNPKSEAFVALNKTQIAEFKCYGYTAYATYLDGKHPDCSSIDDLDGLNNLHFGDKKLHFANDSFNNFLPSEQRTHFTVSNPGRFVLRGTATRAAIQTFRAAEMGAFQPMKVWKADATGQMVIDEELTAQGTTAQPMDSFADVDNTDAAEHLKDARFWGNRAIVKARGFNFKVVMPSETIVSRFNSMEPDANSNVQRGPKAKILINWTR